MYEKVFVYALKFCVPMYARVCHSVVRICLIIFMCTLRSLFTYVLGMCVHTKAYVCVHILKLSV